MSNRWVGIVELAGIVLVAASLLAVAYQIHQERKVALAALNTSQLEAFASRLEAGLGSEEYLSMWSKLYATGTWDTKDLSHVEIAAAEVDALLFWVYAEMAFEHYREGLVDAHAWGEFVVEVQEFYSLPVFKSVFESHYKQTPSEFTKAIDLISQRALH
ncbi:MAG: hypothetical protein ABJ056_05750 [Halioglobus sp.]